MVLTTFSQVNSWEVTGFPVLVLLDHKEERVGAGDMAVNKVLLWI